MTTRKIRSKPVEGYVDFDDDAALRHLLDLSELAQLVDKGHDPLSMAYARHVISKPDTYEHNGLKLRRACSRIYVTVAPEAPIAPGVKDYLDRVGKFGGSHTALITSGYVGGRTQ